MAENMRQPIYTVRPGVTFPDWEVVTSPASREALLRIVEAFGAEKAWRDYTPAEDGVRTTLLRFYAEQGRAPTIDELAGRADVSSSALRPILASLKARDLVVLDADGGAIVGAYPFTDRDTEHRVMVGDRAVNALCAIDALGVGDMYGRDVEIRSRCRSCGAPVEITTSDQGRGLAHVKPATAVVWSGIRDTGGCAASSMCTVIAFFCGDAHLEAWRTEHDPEGRGFRLSMDEALQAGRAFFAPSLAGPEAVP
jgi:hypothetical protein